MMSVILTFSTLLDEIKSIILNLGIPGLTNVQLGEVLISGSADISCLQISEFTVDSITAPDNPSELNAKNVSLDIDIKKARFSVKTDFNIGNIKLGPVTGGVRGTIVMTAAQQTKGNNITLALVFNSPNNLVQQIPTKLLIPDDQCSIELDLGIQILQQ